MKERKNEKNKYRKIIILFIFVLFIVVFLSFGLGHYYVPISQVFKIVFQATLNGIGNIFGNSDMLKINQTWTDKMYLVIINIRLPRIIMSILVGSALSVAGATFQGVFSNPMAAPDILGATSGAGFGAALAILFEANHIIIMISAFLFSVLTIVLVFSVSNVARGNKVVNLLLSGIVISSLFSSGIAFIKLVADPENKLPKITYWLMGSLSGASFQELKFVTIPMLLGMILLMLLSWRVNLLSLDEDEARSLGVDVTHTRYLVIVLATLVTALAVAVSGMIGWVGLVIPHLSRKIVGDDYRKVIPISILFGAVFLLIIDNVSRNLLKTEIPIGILTAFVGSPFFLYLLMRNGKKTI